MRDTRVRIGPPTSTGGESWEIVVDAPGGESHFVARRFTEAEAQAFSDGFSLGTRQPSSPQFVTHSGKSDEHFIREGAILNLAYDAVLGHDSYTAENALEWARAFINAHEEAVHDGDCTKQAHTCCRCMVEGALSQSRQEHGG